MIRVNYPTEGERGVKTAPYVAVLFFGTSLQSFLSCDTCVRVCLRDAVRELIAC